MSYLVTPDFDQTLIEVQMKMWEAAAQMLALGTIILLVIILGSIAWLCLSELSGARRGRLITHEAQREHNLVALFAYREADSLRAHTQTGTIPAQYAARPRRILLRPGG